MHQTAIYLVETGALVYLQDGSEWLEAIENYDQTVGSVHETCDTRGHGATAVVALIYRGDVPQTLDEAREADDYECEIQTGIKPWETSRNLMLTVRSEEPDEDHMSFTPNHRDQPVLPDDGIAFHGTIEIGNPEDRKAWALEAYNEEVAHLEDEALPGSYRIIVLDYTSREEGEEIIDRIYEVEVQDDEEN
ncbi:hypothetical protein [Aureimonas ureilytica]|nr:hypothetical protein [Aureimonas ureilytica]